MENTKNIKKSAAAEQDDDKSTAQSKKGRIILRNLVYDVSEKHLRGLLSKFGEIVEVNLPLDPSTNKAKGFAFIQFANKNCALKAISELNGSKWKGRNIVLDMAVSKEDYKQAVKPQEEADNKKSNKIVEEKAEEKEEKEENEGKGEESNSNEDEEEDDEEEEEDDDEEEEEEEEDEETDNKKSQKKDKKPKTGLFENEDLSQTCFVRNLSFEISDKELRDFCQTFGKVEMAKVCMNHETGNNKGTGFVKFKDPQVAMKLIAKSDEYNSSFLSQKNKKNGSNIHDVFSGVSELDLEMNGRRIIFLEAKKRDDVAKVLEDKNGRNSVQLEKIKTLEQLEAFDRQSKRNLHLAKLGIFEEEKDMTNEEKEKRRSHLQEKITKLKNPNNQVSSTRIALMNLPKDSFQEEEIKLYAQLALTKEFGKDIIKKQNPIKQVLLLRDRNKVDTDGVPKSRGIAFIEFDTHEQALAFLEFSVKDKQIFEKKYKKTPIIEFAIEDIRKMQKKNKIRQMVEQKQKDNKSEKKPKSKDEREQSKLLLQNTNNASKLKITKILNDKSTDLSHYEEGLSLLKDIQSRGIKQRMHKQLKKKFGIESQDKQGTVVDVEEELKKQDAKEMVKQGKEQKRKEILKKKVIEDKAQRKALIKKQKQVEENDLEMEASELIKAVSRELKKNKQKKNAAEEYDDLDDVVEKHLQKKIKKTKQESSQL